MNKINYKKNLDWVQVSWFICIVNNSINVVIWIMPINGGEHRYMMPKKVMSNRCVMRADHFVLNIEWGEMSNRKPVYNHSVDILLAYKKFSFFSLWLSIKEQMSCFASLFFLSSCLLKKNKDVKQDVCSFTKCIQCNGEIGLIFIQARLSNQP